MATGLTFWQMPDEQDAFLDYVAKTGDILAISDFEAVPLRENLRPVPVADFMGHSFKRLHIFPSEFANCIVIREWPPDAQHVAPIYSIDTAPSPLIMYTPGSLTDGALSQSNLSTNWSCLDATGRIIVDKPRGFRPWGERVFRWLRRATPEWYGCRSYRCTSMAAGRAEDGVRLVLYHGWSGKHTGKGSFEV